MRCFRPTLFSLLLGVFAGSIQAKVPDVFTLQGTLLDSGGIPISGSRDYLVNLYDAESNGNFLQQRAGSVLLSAAGRFTIPIEALPASVLDATEVWYQLSIDTAGDGVDGSDQFPGRVRILSVPYALRASDAESLGGQPASDFSTSDNVWTTTGNNASSGDFIGTTNLNALELRANNLQALRLIPKFNGPNVIAGHQDNSADPAITDGGTISGGGFPGFPNRVVNDHSTVGGGLGNAAVGRASTIAGGEQNEATGETSFIGGGDRNATTGRWSTVSGGAFNLSQGQLSAVTGGVSNTAVGEESFVGGGDRNRAAGVNSAIGGGFLNEATTGAAVAGGSRNEASGESSFIGGGLNNKALGQYNAISGGRDNESDGFYSSVGGGRDNVTQNDYSTVAGGRDNVADGFASAIGGGRENRASFGNSTVAGGVENSALGGSSSIGGGSGNHAVGNSSTIAGGVSNSATGDFSTVAGGVLNEAGFNSAAVGGGGSNRAMGQNSTIAGGFNNEAIGSRAAVAGGINNDAVGDFTSVGGGDNNNALGEASVISGGVDNDVVGSFATIPGGTLNAATGAYSFAAGRRAQADHLGSFVWADSQDEDVVSTADDQFLVRAHGGVHLTIRPDGSGLRVLSAGPDKTEPPNVIGGDIDNSVGPNVSGAVIAGGGGESGVAKGTSQEPNQVWDLWGTIGGGSGNHVGSETKGAPTGVYGTVAGGRRNEALGGYSMVPGGRRNRASGQYSFAAGQNAKALQDGCFVWADSQVTDFQSTANDQFLIRAQGGVGIGRTTLTNAFEVEGNASKSVMGDWLMNSDRRIKTEIEDVEDALGTIHRLRPVKYKYTEAYKRDHPSIEDHEYYNYIAQEYAEVFPESVKEDGEGLLLMDGHNANVVAVKAIQELSSIVERQEEIIEKLETRIRDLENGRR